MRVFVRFIFRREIWGDRGGFDILEDIEYDCYIFICFILVYRVDLIFINFLNGVGSNLGEDYVKMVIRK